jgi:hypothetical protein
VGEGTRSCPKQKTRWLRSWGKVNPWIFEFKESDMDSDKFLWKTLKTTNYAAEANVEPAGQAAMAADSSTPLTKRAKRELRRFGVLSSGHRRFSEDAEEVA